MSLEEGDALLQSLYVIASGVAWPAYPPAERSGFVTVIEVELRELAAAITMFRSRRAIFLAWRWQIAIPARRPLIGSSAAL